MTREKMNGVLILRVCLVVLMINISAAMDTCSQNCHRYNQKTLKCTDIPECIPVGVTDVHVTNTTHSTVRITSSNFTGENWNKVTYLQISNILRGAVGREWTISNETFIPLESAEELHINIDRLTVYPNSLVGLSRVKVLDFTGCQSLSISELRFLLNGTDKLPGLCKIVLSAWNTWTSAYDFDDRLIDVILPRNITDIDLSHSHVNFLNMTAIVKRLPHLQVFNLSSVSISSIDAENLQWEDTKHIHMLDISWLGLPNRAAVLPIKYIIDNVILNVTKTEGILPFLNINATGIFKKPTSIWINRCTLLLTKNFHFPYKELELKENNINRFDIIVKDGNLTTDVEYLGLSYNGIEFLAGSIFRHMPNLTKLDISSNAFNHMYEENVEEFSLLLSRTHKLTYINLSNNNLTQIPIEFFSGCHKLSTIDLSFNKLTQFVSNLTVLHTLRTIDLSNNNIKALDASSLHTMRTLSSNVNLYLQKGVVLLSSNPISCSVCEAKPFLQWLLSTELVDIKSQGLICTDEGDNEVSIEEGTISTVHYICIRKSIIISVTVSSIMAVMSAIAVYVWAYKRRKWANMIERREAVINKIREGEGRYEYIVFFSYCSHDDLFAKEIVLPHLKDNLQVITGINRNPICTGDANLRPGFYVHDEIDYCLDKSSVVISLVTENFCMSDYCGSELQKSYIKKKPVILMFKEHVSEDIMSRTMRDFYERNVRILWAEVNGEYVLQTTWDDICTSIIDLIDTER